MEAEVVIGGMDRRLVHPGDGRQRVIEDLLPIHHHGEVCTHQLNVNDNGLPDGVVRVAAAHADTVALGAMSGILSVERA